MAFTNSKLVSYIRRSPMHSGQRTHPISKITIHHMAGNLSVETCGAVFQVKQASSNYGIGSDGRKALYVDEKNRSWASSSSWNDNRAVTIEVANSKSGGDWPVSDKALESLIELCVDICKRNGMKELKYTGKSSGSLTIHSMYAATACPGPYLKSKLSYIGKEVTARLKGEKPGSVEKPTTKPVVSSVPVPSVTYRVKAGGKWYAEVTNLADYAGKVGKAITDVAIKVNKGQIQYRVHVKGGKWLPVVTGYNIKDAVNGYAGNGKPIDAIEIFYKTPEDVVKAHGYRKAKYRVSPNKKGYYTWQYDKQTTGGQDGYAGCFGKTIDRLQITLAK